MDDFKATEEERCKACRQPFTDENVPVMLLDQTTVCSLCYDALHQNKYIKTGGHDFRHNEVNND